MEISVKQTSDLCLRAPGTNWAGARTCAEMRSNMINETISMRMPGSLPESRLITYIQDTYPEVDIPSDLWC